MPGYYFWGLLELAGLSEGLAADFELLRAAKLGHIRTFLGCMSQFLGQVDGKLDVGRLVSPL